MHQQIRFTLVCLCILRQSYGLPLWPVFGLHLVCKHILPRHLPVLSVFDADQYLQWYIYHLFNDGVKPDTHTHAHNYSVADEEISDPLYPRSECTGGVELQQLAMNYGQSVTVATAT